MTGPTGTDARRESGSAVADFCLVMVLLVPLTLGLLQIGIVLHVRNTMSAAAADGARYAARADAGPSDGAVRTRRLIAMAIDDRYADDVVATMTTVDGFATTEIRVHARVPALGLFGPSVPISVEGHAVEEELP